MERFTPLYAIFEFTANLHFDKEGYFHVLSLYGLFYKRNRKHFFRVPIRYRNTRGSLGEFEIAWKHSPYGFVFHFIFSFSQTSTRVSRTVYGNTGNVFYFLNKVSTPHLEINCFLEVVSVFK